LERLEFREDLQREPHYAEDYLQYDQQPDSDFEQNQPTIPSHVEHELERLLDAAQLGF